MSEDQRPSSSFGDPNAQPPTPQQTPASAVFPSPVFETPKNPHGSFADSSGLTPRFAEDYSVFNSTPGNLRGTQGPFADFIPGGHLSSSLGHKRLLSVEELAVEIATRATLPSTNPHVPLPPVEPSRRLPSSPASLILSAKGHSADSDAHLSPTFYSKHNTAKSPKKARRGTLDRSDPPQILSPPPSARKGEQTLAPKVNMQDDQHYGHPDFNEHLQAHEMAAMMGNAGDMFGYPMSAPPTAQAGFWDPAMGMDLDFNAGAAFFQPSHRHTGSFDWNSEIQLFQDPCPPPPPPSSNQENVQPHVQQQQQHHHLQQQQQQQHQQPQHHVQPARRERALAPKPPTTEQVGVPTSSAMQATFHTSIDDPFGMMRSIDGVNPGLLHSRPQTSAMETDFHSVVDPGSAEVAVAEAANSRPIAQPRRTSGTKEAKKGKMPDRSFTSSPVKSSVQPGLGRSNSENRGKKALGRGTLPTLAPAIRPTPQPSSSNNNAEAGRPAPRPSGRISPLKNQRRLSSLASIPESVSQPQLGRPRTSVRFTIDAHGRARAETTVLADEPGSSGGITRSRSSRELSTTRRSWDSSDGESSTDEDPIIIPSRNSSFNASFALPDPRKPVGSIFHPARRSISDRSTSTSTTFDGPGALPNEESEVETVMHDHEKGGDAASELRKVVEDRQKRSMQMENARSQRFLNTSNLGSFNGSTISPVSLTDSTYGTDGQGVRCVCNKKEVDEGNGFMLQCESCEMWLHGRCLNITKRTMPSVYICGFCANTGSMAARRVRDTGRGQTSVLSSLANKTFRSFR